MTKLYTRKDFDKRYIRSLKQKRKEDEYLLTRYVLRSVCEYLLTRKSREEELTIELPHDYKICESTTKLDILDILSKYQSAIDNWVFMLSKDKNMKFIKSLLTSIYKLTIPEGNNHVYIEIDECLKTKQYIFKINACSAEPKRPINLSDSLDIHALDWLLEHLGFDHSGIVRSDGKPKEYFTISHEVPDVLELTNQPQQYLYGRVFF